MSSTKSVAQNERHFGHAITWLPICAIFSASWPACAGVIVSVVAAGEGSAVASAVAIGEWVGAAVVAIGDAVGAVLTVLAEQPTIITLTAAMHISVKNHFFT